MNCQDVQNLISAYVDGELSVRQQEEVRRHLRQCSRCQLRLEAEQLTKAWVRKGYRPETAPLALRTRLRDHLHHHAATVVRRPVWSWMRHPAFAVAAVLVILVGVWVAVRTPRMPTVQRSRETLLYVEHLQGTLDCVNCYLAQKYHVKNYCKEFGHQPALIASDGRVYLFVPNEKLERLTEQKIWHKEVEISGWVLKTANVIELKDVHEAQVVEAPEEDSESVWVGKF